MREIKFRAWRNDRDMATGEAHWYMAYKVEEETLNPLPNQDEPMQFTGLKDKNGKEIYEGDIIQNADGKKLLVYWHNQEAAFRQTTHLTWPGGVRTNGDGEYPYTDLPMNYNFKEVIGNIYENPNLLQ